MINKRFIYKNMLKPVCFIAGLFVFIFVLMKIQVINAEPVIDSTIKITAHRGNSSGAPENTIPAIEQAIGASADYVEIDVRCTYDGVLVLMHDSEMIRTTGLGGYLEEYSWQSLTMLDAGSWYDKAFTGTGIPTLKEALVFCKGRISLNIDLKSGAKGLGYLVAGLIKEYNMETDCVITSTESAYLEEIKAIDAKLRTGIILNNAKEWENYPHADFYSLEYSDVTKELVDNIHADGKEVHIWTVDSFDMLQLASRLGVDNVITNNPALAVKLLRDK